MAARKKKQGAQRPGRLAAFFGFGLQTPVEKKPKKAQPHPAPLAPEETLDQPQPAAAHVFSLSSLLVVAVLAMILMTLAAPLTKYLEQSKELSATQANIAQLKAEQEELKAQISWWKDDNYVKQQARSRLFYVNPGETPYLVVGVDATSSMADDTSAAAKIAPQESWTSKLWGSLQLAAEDTSVSQAQSSSQPSESASPSVNPSGQAGSQTAISSSTASPAPATSSSASPTSPGPSR